MRIRWQYSRMYFVNHMISSMLRDVVEVRFYREFTEFCIENKCVASENCVMECDEEQLVIIRLKYPGVVKNVL